MEKKSKHLEFIQTVIGRQAKNSFLLKGWVMTIIVALFAFSAKDETLKHILAVYSLIFIFWMLDSYYVWQERLFRALYDHVRKLGEEAIDFSMNTKAFSKQSGYSWIGVTTSRTLLAFYIPLMFFTIIFFYLR